jgi:hypothetical protein
MVREIEESLPPRQSPHPAENTFAAGAEMARAPRVLPLLDNPLNAVLAGNDAMLWAKLGDDLAIVVVALTLARRQRKRVGHNAHHTNANHENPRDKRNSRTHESKGKTKLGWGLNFLGYNFYTRQNDV